MNLCSDWTTEMETDPEELTWSEEMSNSELLLLGREVSRWKGRNLCKYSVRRGEYLRMIWSGWSERRDLCQRWWWVLSPPNMVWPSSSTARLVQLLQLQSSVHYHSIVLQSYSHTPHCLDINLASSLVPGLQPPPMISRQATIRIAHMWQRWSVLVAEIVIMKFDPRKQQIYKHFFYKMKYTLQVLDMTYRHIT